jgi:hypothetical protein
VKDLHRDARSLVWLDDVRRDVHYASGRCVEVLSFASIAVMTLAIGVGVNTAIFSAIGTSGNDIEWAHLNRVFTGMAHPHLRSAVGT